MYRKEQFVFRGGKPVLAVVRYYTAKDFEALIEVQQESFPPPFPEELWWSEDQLASHISTYPEGALCVEVEGEIAGSLTGLLIDFDPVFPQHTWSEITGDGSISTHQADAKTLYIADICIKPSHRKLNLGKLLMEAVYERVVHDGLDRVLGGARMPGYGAQAGAMGPEEYVRQVLAGDLKDPVISFLMRCGRTPVGVAADYLEDEDSRNFALLMEWKNPFLALP